MALDPTDSVYPDRNDWMRDYAEVQQISRETPGKGMISPLIFANYFEGRHPKSWKPKMDRILQAVEWLEWNRNGVEEHMKAVSTRKDDGSINLKLSGELVAAMWNFWGGPKVIQPTVAQLVEAMPESI